MSYELLAGLLDDDDDVGAIGADLIAAALDDDDDDEDIAGDDEILEALVSGAGDSEIIGRKALKARTSAKVKKALAKKKLLKRFAAKNGAAVVQRGLERKRRYPLGFVPTNVLAGVTQNIPAAPQNLFRPERLVIPSDIAFDFGVPDIKIGNQSQLVQDVELPGAIFSEVSIDTGVHFDTAEVGNQISCRARNKSAVAIEFSAAVLGTIAK